MNKRLKLMETGTEGGSGGGSGGGGTQTTSQPGNQTQQTTGGSESFKWEEHVKDPETFQAFGKMFPGMKSVEDFAKTAVHQQRKIGQQGGPLPKKPEEFLAFF